MKKWTLPLMVILGFLAAPVFGEPPQLKPLELDGTEWKLTLTFDSGQGKTQTSNDTLTFKDKKFISSNYDKQKYSPTNYTLFAKDDGSTVFETMQTKGDDVVFWHGDLRDQKLRGVVSTHIKGNVKDYSFEGTLTSGTLKLQEPMKVEAPAPAPAAKEPAPVVKEPVSAKQPPAVKK